MPISSKLPLKKKIDTVHNLITFSIVFTNKNGGGGRFNPSPSKLGVFNTPSKLKFKFNSNINSHIYSHMDVIGLG